MKLTESQFAATPQCMHHPEMPLGVLQQSSSTQSLAVSMQEAVGNRTDKSSTLLLPGGQDTYVDIVNDFTYLGSTITTDGKVEEDVTLCIGKAARAFGCLQKAVFKNKRLAVEMKRRVYVQGCCHVSPSVRMGRKHGPLKQKVSGT